MKVSAVILTRGNVDLGPCLYSIDADEVVIRRGHGGVWERWEAAMSAKHDVVYVQDDDCVVDYASVVDAYDPAKVVCNMRLDRRPEYRDGIALVGWGCVFHKIALGAFAQYWLRFADDELFLREADRVFTGLNPLLLIDVPVTHLPVAFGADRMGREARHGDDLKEIRRRIYEVRKSRMKLFGQLVRTAVNIATLPLSVAADVLTLGGVVTDKREPYTAEALRKLKEEAEESE